MLRDLRVCASTVIVCCACSSNGSSDASAGGGGAAGTDSGTAGAAAGSANGEAGGTSAGAGATSTEAGATNAEAGQAGSHEPEAMGGASSVGGAPSSAGGTSAAGSGGAQLGCPNVDSECAGNITGTWALLRICIVSSANAFSSGPFTKCEGLTIRYFADESHTMTFNADLSYTQSAGTNKVTTFVDAPKACLSGGTCASMASGLDLMNVNIVDHGSICEGSGTTALNATSKSGTYTINGNTLITDGKTDRPVSYCVKADTLVIKVVQDKQVIYETFTRE